MYSNQIGARGTYPSLDIDTSEQLRNNPFAPSAPTLPLHLLDLDTQVPAPYYPLINNDGTLSYPSSTPTWTANWPESFPVAPTLEAAQNYTSAMHCGLKPLDSVEQFIQNTKFSEVQKSGIQAYYTKNHMPIGIAHQLEDLVGYRFEFMLDDHKDTSPHEFESMKREICKRVELLRHIPNAGITIRSFSEYANPRTYHVEHESLSEQVFFNIRDDLLQRQLSKNTGSFQQVYETAVGDAVYSGIKTIPYVFSARDLTQGRDSNSAHVKTLAKNLTKAVVNRPEMMAPTAFFPCSTNKKSNAIIDKLDTIAKKIGVIRPFDDERKEIIKQQSKRFPFSEGCHIQASMLCPVNPFWDEIDEGRLFSKLELENHLGTPVKAELYDVYFNEALDLQASIFMKEEAQSEQNNASHAMGWNSPKLPNISFETNTQSKYLELVPSLCEQIEALRTTNPAWTDEVEEGINRMCTENGIPIGIGIHMFQVVGKHHEFNIDNSYSMGYRADQTDEQARPLTDSHGRYHRSRMEELKSLLNVAGSLLSYLPTKGVTISTMYDHNRVENHPQWTLKDSGLNNRELFLRELAQIISPIQPSGSTPLNRTAQYVYERASQREEKTNVIFFTDGQPSDHTSSFGSSSHRAPYGSIVSSASIREFIKRLANRDADHIPVTIAQTTNNPKAVAWSNLADKVCKKTNAIDDKDSEIAEVKAHHGKSFYYNEKIYAIALLLGNDNPLFDGLDENGIFSKEALECLYGRPMTDNDYDHYFDETYALQCEPRTETLKSTSVSEYANWAKKSSAFITSASSSTNATPRNRLTKLTQMREVPSIERPLLTKPNEGTSHAPSAESSTSAQVHHQSTASKKASKSWMQRLFSKR